MRKCKFITGTISLTLALTVGVTSMAHMSESVPTEKLVCEYETTTVDVPVEIVEKSVNEVNILMATEELAEDITLETETKAPVISKVVKEVEQTTKKNERTSKKEGQTAKKNVEKNKKNEDNSIKSTKNNKNVKKNKKSTLKSMGTYRVTAYCSCSYCCGKSNGITASGTKAKEGRTVAADTSVLPFGTDVVIAGKTYTVEDRGGAIAGKRIDVYFDSHKKALSWGVKYLKVYVKN